MKTEKLERTTLLTTCCEVEREVSLIESICPECGQTSPDTIRRVTIERKVRDGHEAGTDGGNGAN